MSPDPRAGRAVFGLEGRVAVVTGAGSLGPGIGNGRAAAILLARAGAAVALVDRDGAAAEDTRRTIADEGGDAVVVVADVADRDAACEAVAATVGEFGRLDVLVNNVGVAGPGGSATEVDLDRWEAALAVNVSSMMLMARYAIPHMRRAGGGAIVNVSSTAGLRAGHPALLYATSKGAVVQLSRTMAGHHGADGIRVNCVAPGAVYTPMVISRGMSEELRAQRSERSLLGTEGNGWDTGMAVLFLASALARWITGVVLPVDGGYAAAGLGIPTPLRAD